MPGMAQALRTPNAAVPSSAVLCAHFQQAWAWACSPASDKNSSSLIPLEKSRPSSSYDGVCRCPAAIALIDPSAKGFEMHPAPLSDVQLDVAVREAHLALEELLRHCVAHNWLRTSGLGLCALHGGPGWVAWCFLPLTVLSYEMKMSFTIQPLLLCLPVWPSGLHEGGFLPVTWRLR